MTISRWKKTALWGALAATTAVGAVVAAGVNSPEVDPVYFALPTQPTTGNPVDCVGNNDPLKQTLSLGYPIGVRFDGKGIGTWDVYLPTSGEGDGKAVAHNAAAPAGAYAFAGTITITDVAGDSNAINYSSTIAVSAVVVKAGSGGERQASSVYAYVRPPEANAQAGNDLLDFGWTDPASGFPGAQLADQALDSPPAITQGISHLDFCFDPQPTVTKDVNLSWKRWQDWTISKTVNGKEVENLAMDVGGNVDVAYLVTASPTNLRSRFRAVGSITINDPLRRGYTLQSVTDTITIDGHQFVATGGNKGAFESFSCAPSDVGATIFTCSYAIELASGDYNGLAAGDSVVNKVDVVLAHASGNKSISYTTAGVVFAGTPNASYGDTLDVDDSLLADNHVFPAGGDWSYPIKFTCPDPNDGQRVNTVVGTYSTGENTTDTVDDSATVNYVCRTVPSVDKSASGSSQRRYDWTMDKAVTPTSVSMFDGDKHALDYTVTATRNLTSNTITVSGSIRIKDAEEAAFSVESISDTVTFGGVDYPASVGTCVADAIAGNGIVYTCPYTVAIGGNSHPGVTSGSNKVVASLKRTSDGHAYNGLEFSTGFNVSAQPDVGASLVVTDPMAPDSPKTFTDSGSWNYPGEAACDPARQENYGFSIDNTATGKYGTPETTLTESANVAVTCSTVVVEKSAAPSYRRNYAWAADKRMVVPAADINDANDDTCLPNPVSAEESAIYAGSRLCSEFEVTLNPGGRYDTVYRVAAQRNTASEDLFHVTGSIDARWPADVADPVFSPAFPSDTLHLDGGATVQGSVACSGLNAINNVLECTYNADLASKTNGYNVASFTRPRLCYTAAGVASACGGNSTYTSNQAGFAFGDPSQETNACALLDDVFNAGGLNLGASFTLALNDGAQVCGSGYSTFLTGDGLINGVVPYSFDILADWIPPASIEDLSCLFVVPNALNVAFGGQQPATSTAHAGVHVPAICDQQQQLGCTYTQGYWKTHVIYAPKPKFERKRDPNWDLIDGAGLLNEAAPFYQSGMTYIQVMWTPPKGGNNYYKLAHQFIAAQLNVLSGASDADVADTMAAATAMFVAHPNPNDTFWSRKGSAAANTLAGILASFNEGATGPGHCSESIASKLAAQ